MSSIDTIIENVSHLQKECFPRWATCSDVQDGLDYMNLFASVFMKLEECEFLITNNSLNVSDKYSGLGLKVMRSLQEWRKRTVVDFIIVSELKQFCNIVNPRFTAHPDLPRLFPFSQIVAGSAPQYFWVNNSFRWYPVWV